MASKPWPSIWRERIEGNDCQLVGVILAIIAVLPASRLKFASPLFDEGEGRLLFPSPKVMDAHGQLLPPYDRPIPFAMKKKPSRRVEFIRMGVPTATERVHDAILALDPSSRLLSFCGAGQTDAGCRLLRRSAVRSHALKDRISSSFHHPLGGPQAQRRRPSSRNGCRRRRLAKWRTTGHGDGDYAYAVALR